MAYIFKSKALQAQNAKNAKNAEREASARSLLAQIGAQFVRVKQSVEELWGERGSNRALRVSDFAVFKARRARRDNDYTMADVRRDIADIKAKLAKIAEIKGPAK